MSALERRLRWYWVMEAANVLLVPAGGILIVHFLGGVISAPLLASAAVASVLLVIGTLYLRAIHQQSLRNPKPLTFWVPILAALELPAALLVLGAVAFTGFDMMTAADRSRPDRFMAAALALLAVLEFVNYYYIQLQHFDHAVDFKRLISGKGFRKSALARDIARWRRDRRA